MSPSSGRGSVRAAELRPLSWASFRMGVLRVGMAMTTIDRAALTRTVYFHDPSAPVAGAVVPSVFVAVRWLGGRLLLVQRCDSGAWELPGGRVDVGETAVEAAVRETAEEAGVHVVVTAIAGVFSDPGHVVRSPDGEVRQQLAIVFRARAVGGLPTVICTRPATRRGSRSQIFPACRSSRRYGCGSLTPSPSTSARISAAAPARAARALLCARSAAGRVPARGPRDIARPR